MKLICFGGNERLHNATWEVFQKGILPIRSLQQEYLFSIQQLDIAILFLRKEYEKAGRLTQESLNSYPESLPETGKLRLRIIKMIIFLYKMTSIKWILRSKI